MRCSSSPARRGGRAPTNIARWQRGTSASMSALSPTPRSRRTLPRSGRKTLGIDAKNVALFFGHVRPFKALDIVLKAWGEIETDALLLVAGEAWWESADKYRAMAKGNVRFDFRFIPDAEIATYFA